MAKKKTTAVKKAAKTPTVKELKKEISRDTARETTLKHDAATAKTDASRKHDLAEAHSIGKKVTTLKHELARKTAKKKTGLALAPDDVACCAAQAVAASLRLALGVTVHDEDMLGLYWRAAHDPEGADVLDVLRAAAEYGLAGAQPRWTPVAEPLCTCGFVGAGQAGFGAHEAICCAAEEARGVSAREDALHASLTRPVGAQLGSATVHGLILGLELPGGPHAVTAAPGGTWWSWGEPYSPGDFAGAVLSEAWAVSWS